MQKWEYAVMTLEGSWFGAVVTFSHRADVWRFPSGKEALKQFEAELKVAYPGLGAGVAAKLHILRRLGDEGWELVASGAYFSMMSSDMLFKRPLE